MSAANTRYIYLTKVASNSVRSHELKLEEKIISISDDSIMLVSLEVLHSINSNVSFTQSIKNIRSGLTN